MCIKCEVTKNTYYNHIYLSIYTPMDKLAQEVLKPMKLKLVINCQIIHETVSQKKNKAELKRHNLVLFLVFKGEK